MKLYSAAGKFLSVVAAPKDFARNVVGLDLAVDSRERIYVLDPARKTVRIFAAIKRE